MQPVTDYFDGADGPDSDVPQRPAGSMGHTAPPIPPTLTVEHLEFLDGTDEVPPALLDKFWGLLTRHNQLTNLTNYFEIERFRSQCRVILMLAVFEGHITLLEKAQLIHYVDNQVRKSFNSSERSKLTPTIHEIRRGEESEQMAMMNPQRGGLISKGMSMVFGGGGR